MAFQIRRVEYFYAFVTDQPGDAYKLLSELAEVGVNLLAFAGMPVGPTRTQLTLFPDDARALLELGRNAGLDLDGPHPALLVQGDDRLGLIAGIHEKLARVDVNVFASTGVTDGEGSYGYVLYVRPDKIETAAAALGA